MENIPTWIAVVAAAIAGQDRRWLMHQRPLGKQHGGLWEFPGGKVEASEIPGKALVRELEEELGINVATADLVPSCFAESPPQQGQPGIVILLYTVTSWDREPMALEGGNIGWFLPEEIARLEKPPLDVVLARQHFAKL